MLTNGKITLQVCFDKGLLQHVVLIVSQLLQKLQDQDSYA
ncbi:hypothetical protein Lser_V15G29322 [Lactuca serriola]